MMKYDEKIVDKIADTLIHASSTFTEDKINAYLNAIKDENNSLAKWTMEEILRNADVACKNKSPLCDDTGIPHIIIDVGKNSCITGVILESIKEGIRQGLSRLPGRPMAVKGNDVERIEQSLGMYDDPACLEPAPILIRNTEEDYTKVHIMMLGGGPAIRGKTYRVFHKHDINNVLNEIVDLATEGAKLLGCTPCTLAVGIGRSQYEASSLMLQAMLEGNYSKQNELEKTITNRVNDIGVGALGLGGKTTVLSTFLKVGPQRASGIRVVSLRPCCCYEPRKASVII